MLLFLTLIDNDVDKEKFTYIYNNYRGLVIKTIGKYFNDNYDIEDAAQLVFVRIAKAISNIDTDNSKMLSAYIITVSRNCCVDLLRKRRSEPQTVSIDHISKELLHADGFEAICSREIIIEVSKYILKMPLIYRDVLYLYFVCEMSVKNISISLEISQKTVRTRLSRGINKLQKKVKELGYE